MDTSFFPVPGILETLKRSWPLHYQCEKSCTDGEQMLLSLCVFTHSVKGSHAGRFPTRLLSCWSLVGPWPPKEECLGAQTLFPRFLGLLASAWLPSGWRLHSKEEKNLSPSLFLTFGDFSISKELLWCCSSYNLALALVRGHSSYVFPSASARGMVMSQC